VIRVLFVDDDEAVLEGLENRLRKQRNVWKMRFAGSGTEALRMLAREPADVVVSDMRMPGMDGAELLGQVRELYPATVRLVLTGETGLQGAMQTVPVAHQVLTKPCDAGRLEESINRLHQIRSIDDAGPVNVALGALGSLPTLPTYYQELIAALDDPELDTDHVASIIEKDVAMTARLLQVMNSPLFGGRGEVTSVRAATVMLGRIPIRGIAQSLAFFHAFSGELPAGFSLVEFDDHAQRVAALASRLTHSSNDRRVAYTGGLLHDIGELALYSRLPEQMAELDRRAHRHGPDRIEAEQALLGCSHARVGAQLLTLWGLPEAVVDVVAHHHQPSAVPRTTLDACGAVHVAEVLVARRLAGGGPEDNHDFDLDYLRQAALTSEIGRWVELERSDND